MTEKKDIKERFKDWKAPDVSPETLKETESFEERLSELKRLGLIISKLTESGQDIIRSVLKSFRGLSRKKVVAEEDVSVEKEAENIVKKTYEEAIVEFSEEPWTEEKIKEQFSEENLVSLSLEDYIKLLRKYPEVVSHVIRQGVRDHWGHTYHTAGQGEYQDSFMQLLKDGHLRSPLGVFLQEGSKEEAMIKWLRPQEGADEETVLKSLDQYIFFFSQQLLGGTSTFIDKASIHFAYEDVEDAYYGSESYNEIFFVYPVAFIAVHYPFQGLVKEGDLKYNDTWVLDVENKGMDVNAGIVFISKNEQVDLETGSKYKIGPDGKAVENKKYQDILRRVSDEPQFESLLREMAKIDNEYNRRHGYSYWVSDDALYIAKNEVLEKIEEILEIKISDYRLRNILKNETDKKFISQLLNLKDLQTKGEKPGFGTIEERLKEVIRTSLFDARILYARAENTISSEDFWENYFKQHPEQKPSKIVYYTGTPQEALLAWRSQNKIPRLNAASETQEIISKGRSRISDEILRLSPYIAEMRLLAREAIGKYFQKKRTEENLGQE